MPPTIVLSKVRILLSNFTDDKVGLNTLLWLAGASKDTGVETHVPWLMCPFGHPMMSLCGVCLSQTAEGDLK
jgi:hypothetical protein